MECPDVPGKLPQPQGGMMKKLRILILFFMLIISVTASAQSESESRPQAVPEGMEAVRIGGSGWLIVPQGAKTRKVGAQVIVEGSKEYMSRRFLEMEKRFTGMEKDQEDLKQEVAELKELVAELRKK